MHRKFGENERSQELLEASLRAILPVASRVFSRLSVFITQYIFFFRCIAKNSVVTVIGNISEKQLYS